MTSIHRRSFIRGLSLFVAAPAIIRVADLMPIKVWIDTPATPAWPPASDEYEYQIFKATQPMSVSHISMRDGQLLTFSKPLVLQQGKWYAAGREYRNGLATASIRTLKEGDIV